MQSMGLPLHWNGLSKKSTFSWHLILFKKNCRRYCIVPRGLVWHISLKLVVLRFAYLYVHISFCLLLLIVILFFSYNLTFCLEFSLFMYVYNLECWSVFFGQAVAAMAWGTESCPKVLVFESIFLTHFFYLSSQLSKSFIY